MPNWQGHKLPEIKNFEFIKVSIVQTGQGDFNYELRLLVKENGLTNLYYKELMQDKWNLLEQSAPVIGIVNNNFEILEQDKKPVVFNWKQKKCRFYNNNDVKVFLFNFNEDSYNSKLIVNCKDIQYKFNLLKRKNLIVDTFHSNSKYYDLVSPTYSERVMLCQINDDTINIHSSNINFLLKKRVYTSS